jgi:hypothetical protein
MTLAQGRRAEGDLGVQRKGISDANSRRLVGDQRGEGGDRYLGHKSRHKFFIDRGVDQHSGSHDASLARGNKSRKGNSVDGLGGGSEAGLPERLTCSISASSKMSIGAFPPSSVKTPARFAPAAAPTCLPVAVPPVKSTFLTWGCEQRACPVWGPKPGTTLKTPGGNPD